MSEAMSLFHFRREQAMDLKEQLKKVLSDQKKLERKKDDFMEEYEGKKKKILLKKKELEQKIQKKKTKRQETQTSLSFCIRFLLYLYYTMPSPFCQ